MSTRKYGPEHDLPRCEHFEEQLDRAIRRKEAQIDMALDQNRDEDAEDLERRAHRLLKAYNKTVRIGCKLTGAKPWTRELRIRGAFGRYFTAV